MLETNKKYLVKDSSHIGLLYNIELKQSKEADDLYIVKDYLYNEEYYMTADEILNEFTFIG